MISFDSALDQVCYLQGDEDSGVGINCRICDRGGAPIAYYTHPDDRTWNGTDVQVVFTIAELIEAGDRHKLQHTEA